MTWDPTASLKALQTALQKTGYFAGGAQIGEPFSPPPDLTAAVFFLEWGPSQVTLNTSIDVWTLQVRVYQRAGMSPENAETVELSLANAISHVAAAFAGAFTLGGTVRAIAYAGEEGHKIAAKWGHIDVSGTIFRCVDLAVPLIVDDGETFVA